MEYRTGSHTVYDIEYHVVWITKYRYKVLTGEVALHTTWDGICGDAATSARRSER